MNAPRFCVRQNAPTVPLRGSTWDCALLGEPRTVFGPLAARSVPSPRWVLRPWRDRPQASGVPGFLLWPAQAGCKVRLEPHGGVGSSLLPILWWGRVTPNPSPCSLGESTSADDQRRRMVGAGLGGSLFQCCKPVLQSPPRGVGRIDGDDGQPLVGGHLREALAELSRGDARHEPPESAAPPAPRGAPAGVFPTLASRFGEVKVLDHNRRTQTSWRC